MFDNRPIATDQNTFDLTGNRRSHMPNHRIEGLIEDLPLGRILAAQGIAARDCPDDIVGNVILEEGRRIAVLKRLEGGLYGLDCEHSCVRRVCR